MRFFTGDVYAHYTMRATRPACCVFFPKGGRVDRAKAPETAGSESVMLGADGTPPA